MRYRELKRRLDVLQRVRRKVDALAALGAVSDLEWRAFNGVFTEEVERTIDADPRWKKQQRKEG